MKKKVLVWISICLVCTLCLTGCGLKKKAKAPVATPAPAQTVIGQPEATEAPVMTPTPTQEPVATPAPTETPAPTPAPTEAPVATPAPTETPAPLPSPSVEGAPKVTKNPTGETVKQGGYCSFVAHYENAIWAKWHFVSPDGNTDLDYMGAAKNFPGMEIAGGDSSVLTLKTVPASVSGWSVYCDFSNNVAHTSTAPAKITVTGANGSPVDPQSGLPTVTKSPTDETVKEGGSCYFVSRYNDAIWAVWHFVSPDGSTDIDYLAAMEKFPTMKILGGETRTMQLKDIPKELDGWSFYCDYSNYVGHAKTASAKITVTAAGTTAATPAPKATPTPTAKPASGT